MKRKFTILTAVFALLAFLTVPMGMRGQTTKTYKLTIDASDFNTTSYAANNNEKTSDAVNINDANDTYEVSWTSYQVMKSGNNMQWQKSKGCIYNSTDLGTITAVTVTSSAGTFTTYYGTGEQPSTNTAVGGGYFQTKVGVATGTTSKLEVTFEVVADGPQIVPTTVTIDASDITNTDVYTSTAAGSLNATVTENTNNTAISGATVTWSSSNENVATIDANGEVTLVAAGTTTITASYAGESGVYGGSSATYELVVSDNTPFTGGDVTFDAGTDMGSSTTNTDGDEMTKKTVTISSSKAAFGYNDSYRIYSGSTTTISTTYGVITEIVFTGSSSNPLSNLSLGSASSGSYSVVNSVGTWTGNATSVSFSATAQARATQIVVTVAAPAAVAAPTFSPETGTYYETQNVTISCETPNSTIYYTTDGSEPTSASTQYSQAITVNETTTIKAIAYVGTDHGYVSTATYTIVQPYSTIQEIFNAATNTPTAARIAFDNWVVTGVNNSSHAFVSDGTNGFMIYGSDHGFSAGDILSGTVECSIQMYNNALELTNLNSSTTGLTVTPGGTVSVADIAIANLAPINTGALVSYQNLTCSVNTSGNYTNYNLTDGTTQIQVYHTIIGSLDNLLEDGKTYNITGIFVQNNSTKRVNPRSAADIEEVEVQHEEYTLTVTPSANVEIYTFVSNDPNEEGQPGELIAQVYDGTTVGLSVSAASGYMLESVLVDGVDVTSQLDDTGWYEFTMPTHDVAVTATAVEYIAPTPGNYARISSLDQLTDGSKVIIAARYDEEHANGYYAMQCVASGKPEGVQFTSVVSDGNEMLPSTIADDEETYYWNVNVTDGSYTFTNANGQMIGYPTSGTNFGGTNTAWTIRLETAGENAMVAEYAGFVIKNGNTATRAFAFNGTVFGAYATSNMNAAGYNFFLDFFVESNETPVTEPHMVYFFPGTGTCVVDTMYRGGAFTLPDASTTCDGWEFVGWSSQAVNETTSAPEGLLTETFTATEATTLYAVYSDGDTYSSFPVTSPITLPYFNDFETSAPGYQAGDPGNGRTYVKPEGWTIVSQTPPTTRRARPQVFYTPSYAHSGNFSLRLDSAAVTAMPRLSDDIDVSELKMEFYVRQPNAGQYLEVGVMTDLADPGSFVSVDTIDNSTSAVTHWYVDFGGYENNSAEHHYIAFRNSGATNRSINNIDDISLYKENPCELSLSDLPYTETFDSVTEITSPVRTGVQPECWVVAHQYESLTNTTKPQVFYTPSYANSGNYSLRMEGRCIYAMPKLAEDVDVRALHMELYLRQPNASQQLEVGVMSNLNDEETFVSVATISNNGTGVEYKLIDFSGYSGTGKYIAFRNSVVGGGTGKSINNIDDISLYVENPCEVSLSDLPYTETFDNVTEITSTDRTGEQPECWTVAHRYTQLTNTTKPQVFYTSSYAHSGSYSLRMEGQCIYAMPKLAEDIDVSMLQMELYVRQPYADQQLEVGVMSNLNDPTTFQTVLTINTTPRVVEQVVFDFSEYSGTGKYIAFRNSVVGDGTGKSINNIDDITLSVPEAKIAEVSGENEIDANSVERYLEDIRVYPNPTTGNLYIDAMDVQKVECFNQMGQLVGVYDNANELNISELSNGVYMLRITVPQGVTMRKVVKK